ncbi:MAG: DUF2071 domain-containing protein [Planctomycetes bacterium]|nr:DUF2071 domain-containing protein [Planctomycetota bacterium]
MAMSWHDLLFAHWPLAPDAVREFVPPCLELDLFDGNAWVAVVPFRMTGVRARFTPAVPGPGAFSELNLRTYVRVGGKSGVYFWSLDAASRVAVRAARAAFHLPYYDAAMECVQEGDDIAYTSRRTHRGAPCAELVVRYGPTGAPFHAKAGTLEHWLTERYCLYAVDAAGVAHRGDIHHAPWVLQPGWAEFGTNTIAAAAGLRLPSSYPHLLFARRLDVVAWLPVPVES